MLTLNISQLMQQVSRGYRYVKYRKINIYIYIYIIVTLKTFIQYSVNSAGHAKAAE